VSLEDSRGNGTTARASAGSFAPFWRKAAADGRDFEMRIGWSREKEGDIE